MLDLITRKEAEAMVRKAVEEALAAKPEFVQQAVDHAIRCTYETIGADLRQIAGRFKNVDGERAARLVADTLISSQRKH